MRAVIFDFFGTLTDPAAEESREANAHETAAALGVAGPAFWAALSGSFGERIVGAHGDTRTTLAGLARECGVTPAADQLDRACGVHHAGAARVRRPRPEALAVLRELRGRGFRLGLLSDCGSELVEHWPGSPYADAVDEPVFSWREGRRKPDPRLYATVARRLGVAPGECWYAGDGGGRELSGALTAGMRAVLVTNALVPGAAKHRVDPDETIPEHTVDDLTGLLPLVGHAAAEPMSGTPGGGAV